MLRATSDVIDFMNTEAIPSKMQWRSVTVMARTTESREAGSTRRRHDSTPLLPPSLLTRAHSPPTNSPTAPLHPSSSSLRSKTTEPATTGTHSRKPSRFAAEPRCRVASPLREGVASKRNILLDIGSLLRRCVSSLRRWVGGVREGSTYTVTGEKPNHHEFNVKTVARTAARQL